MKKLIVLALVLVTSISLVKAQDVEVDKKTGLVKVDGKEAFYLTPKNKTMMTSDFALENLDHKELAYLKYDEGVRYTSNGTKSTTNYLMVFSASGNQCVLTDFNLITGIMKPIAKKIAAANLVQNGEMSQAEERKFIIINKGSFVKEAAPAPSEKVIVVNDQQRSAGPADISLKENKIYNNSELVGLFKNATDGNKTVISVYNNMDALVCTASHENGNDNADWNINSDGKNMTILYNNATPLEKLFKYLVEKGML
jgi:hypothetical protein